MDGLKELLLSAWEWLVANPPWFIGITAAVALLLWWSLHIVPKRKHRRLMAEHDALQRLMAEKRRKASQEQMRMQNEQRRQNEQSRIENLEREYKRAAAEREEWERKYNELREDRQDEQASRRTGTEENAKPQPKDEETDAINKQAAEAAQAAKREAGKWFENKVIESLTREFRGEICSGKIKLIHNVRYSQEDWKNQIDILMLHRSGIYIIECKYWDGFILGRFGWEKWFKISCETTDTQVPTNTDANPPRCNAFTNPIRQTDSQKETFRQFLLENKDRLNQVPYQYMRIIVMGDKSDLSFVDTSKLCGNEKYVWVGNMRDAIYAIKERMRLPLPSNVTGSRLAPLEESKYLLECDVNAIYNLCKKELICEEIINATIQQ